MGDGNYFRTTVYNFKTLPAPGTNTQTKIAITADIGARAAPLSVAEALCGANKSS